jgi:signal transduction histidine kinase
MKRTSIRLRLWSAAAISIVLALALAGAGLRYLFERHVERQVESELVVDLNQVIGATRYEGVSLSVSPTIADPRFLNPLSGRYWQVSDIASGVTVRSRSLWDGAISLPASIMDGQRHLFESYGPDGRLLLAVDRAVTDAGGRSFRVVVAEDHDVISEAVSAYVAELAPALVLLALVLIAAIFVQITIGLAPLTRLRDGVREVLAGRQRRLLGNAPAEVRPLTEEINHLLETQERALGRARSRAADLAHGLKTPLQVLSGDIRALRDRGEAELAGEIDVSVNAIRRHVERELARARVASRLSGPVQRSNVRNAVAGVLAVVERRPDADKLTFSVDVPADLTALIDEGDLVELLGNLLENASRFARSNVRIKAIGERRELTIAISDDGPGIPEGERDTALSRGASDGGGSGLGLAIVSDIVSAYGGRLILTDACPGLTVTVLLPESGDALREAREEIDLDAGPVDAHSQ